MSRGAHGRRGGRRGRRAARRRHVTRDGIAAPNRQIAPLTTAKRAQLGATGATTERRVVVSARQPCFDKSEEWHA